MLDSVNKIMIDLHEQCQLCKTPFFRFVCSLGILAALAVTLGMGMGFGFGMGS